MINNNKRELPGQGDFFNLLYPDRAYRGPKSSPASDTTDDVKQIFGEYTCKSLRWSWEKKNTDAFGNYCKVIDAPCVYPDCSVYQPVKQ